MHEKTKDMKQTMKQTMKQKRKYDRPWIKVVELKHRTRLLADSEVVKTKNSPNYNGFNEEKEW